MIFAACLASLAFGVPQSDYQMLLFHQCRLAMLSWSLYTHESTQTYRNSRQNSFIWTLLHSPMWNTQAELGQDTGWLVQERATERPASSAEAPGCHKLSERPQIICKALPLGNKIKPQSSSDRNEVTGVRRLYLQTNPTLRISLQQKRRVYIHFLLTDEGCWGSSCPLHNIFLCSCLQEKEIHPKWRSCPAVSEKRHNSYFSLLSSSL